MRDAALSKVFDYPWPGDKAMKGAKKTCTRRSLSRDGTQQARHKIQWEAERRLSFDSGTKRRTHDRHEFPTR